MRFKFQKIGNFNFLTLNSHEVCTFRMDASPTVNLDSGRLTLTMSVEAEDTIGGGYDNLVADFEAHDPFELEAGEDDDSADESVEFMDHNLRFRDQL